MTAIDAPTDTATVAPPADGIILDADGLPVAGQGLEKIDEWMFTERRRNVALGRPAGQNCPKLRLDAQAIKSTIETLERQFAHAQNAERQVTLPDEHRDRRAFQAALTKLQAAEYSSRQAESKLMAVRKQLAHLQRVIAVGWEQAG
jgi:hypothetical protein